MVVVYWSWNGESCPEIKYFSLFLEQLCFSTYPRKGTETGRHSHHTSLSDIFQLIPARGRKPKLRLRLARDLFISTYPRKGTETRNYNHQTCPHRISTYPRKGTKTMLFIIVSTPLLLQLIPARGQKTPHQKWCGVFLLRALTFRFSWAFSLGTELLQHFLCHGFCIATKCAIIEPN